jgi:hypothetical protein
LNVRFGSLADIAQSLIDVRFVPKADTRGCRPKVVKPRFAPTACYHAERVCLGVLPVQRLNAW